MIRRRSSPRRGRAEPVATLDIGAHKICCLVADVEGTQTDQALDVDCSVRVLGFGHQRSCGIAAGGIVDMGLACAAVGAAIAQAEQGAGLRIDNVAVSFPGPQRSRVFSGHVDLASGIVDDLDVARLDEGAYAYARRDREALIGLSRQAFNLDGIGGIEQPVGLAGRRLEALHHAVTASHGTYLNFTNLLEACQIEPSMIAPAGYASGLAATTPDERRRGVIAIDIGAATTAIAAFADRHFVGAATMSFGGQHITEDVSRELSLPLVEAERIKTLYGSVVVAASDEHDPVLLPRSPGDVGQPLATRGQLCRIMRRRVDWMMSGIRACLDEMRSEQLAQANVVVTGGAAELAGLDAVASTALGCSVRLASEPLVRGAGGQAFGGLLSPSFSGVVGLALMASRPSPWIESPRVSGRLGSGYLGRVEQWLRESF